MLVEQVVLLVQRATQVTLVIPEQMAALVAAVAAVADVLLGVVKVVLAQDHPVLLAAQVLIQRHQLTEQVVLLE